VATELAPQAQPELTDDQRAMALEWFGYGRWQAAYWFVGIEPGGDELDACFRMWDALGRAELVDIAARHEEHQVDWFGPDVTQPQRTWQKLIWLLLQYKDKDPTPEAVLAYQKARLGRADGETALIEMCGLPAKNNGVDIPRMLFRKERTDVLAQRMREHRPEFVVFYSPNNRKGRQYVDAWDAISGVTLVRDQPEVVGQTVCVMTYHPNGKWSKDYWREIADRIKAIADPVPRRNCS
jgi:hypothetical protein